MRGCGAALTGISATRYAQARAQKKTMCARIRTSDIYIYTYTSVKSKKK